MPSEAAVLIPALDLQRRRHELAARLSEELHREAEPPVYVMVLEGARVFAEDLLALLPGQPEARRIRVSSYAGGRESSGAPRIEELDAVPAAGRNLVILEDIVDTGRTARCLIEHFAGMHAKSISLVSMLSKPARRVVDVPLLHWGFEIPDRFVIGYGMDLGGKYRELPEVRVLT